MKRKIISFMMAGALLLSLPATAFASADNEYPTDILSVHIEERASKYLDGYSVGVDTRGNGTIAVAMNVDGIGIMDKIGVREVEIWYKENGVWKYKDSLYGAEHPEFYDYNSRDYMGTTYFQGTPGVTYQVVLRVYAENSTGSDTGEVTSPEIVCK